MLAPVGTALRRRPHQPILKNRTRANLDRGFIEALQFQQNGELN
jgi:hypothetical protein